VAIAAICAEMNIRKETGASNIPSRKINLMESGFCTMLVDIWFAVMIKTTDDIPKIIPAKVRYL